MKEGKTQRAHITPALFFRHAAEDCSFVQNAPGRLDDEFLAAIRAIAGDFFVARRLAKTGFD
jgi:hypothetical protein